MSSHHYACIFYCISQALGLFPLGCSLASCCSLSACSLLFCSHAVSFVCLVHRMQIGANEEVAVGVESGVRSLRPSAEAPLVLANDRVPVGLMYFQHTCLMYSKSQPFWTRVKYFTYMSFWVQDKPSTT